jgi:hypothetical protein
LDALRAGLKKSDPVVISRQGFGICRRAFRPRDQRTVTFC